MSEGKRIEDWPIRVSVYLAFLSGFTNAFLRFAFAEGVEISWWTKALHTSSIQDLHYHSSYRGSLLSILASKGTFKLIRLTGFIITFIFINGPLLQRALVLIASFRETSVNLTIPISLGPFVKGATGVFTIISDTPDFFTPAFRRVVLEQSRQSNISLSHTNCKGICEANIFATDFNVSCELGYIPTTLPGLHGLCLHTVQAGNLFLLRSRAKSIQYQTATWAKGRFAGVSYPWPNGWSPWGPEAWRQNLWQFSNSCYATRLFNRG